VVPHSEFPEWICFHQKISLAAELERQELILQWQLLAQRMPIQAIRVQVVAVCLSSGELIFHQNNETIEVRPHRSQCCDHTEIVVRLDSSPHICLLE
jgi:hypothetical protein